MTPLEICVTIVNSGIVASVVVVARLRVWSRTAFRARLIRDNRRAAR